eukprot:scaffold75709_cov57-Phaeocystis_antarctica.AAC.2
MCNSVCQTRCEFDARSWTSRRCGLLVPCGSLSIGNRAPWCRGELSLVPAQQSRGRMPDKSAAPLNIIRPTL